MVIREMNRDECLRLLARTTLARLACCHENQPYVVPVSLAYHSSGSQACLYGFTTPGQKVEWMRANPRVCVEVDEVTADNEWVSVVVCGRYEELAEAAGRDGRRLPAQAKRSHGSISMPHVAELDNERLLAYEALKSRAIWWEPAAAVRESDKPDKPFIPIFYTVRIDEVTGREATRN